MIILPNYIGDKQDKEYEELRRLSSSLKIPIPEVFITMETKKYDGEQLHIHTERAHSWTRNGYNWLVCQMCGVNFSDAGTFGGGYINMKNINGDVETGASPLGIIHSHNAEQAGWGFLGALNDDDNGIIIGTGSTAYSFEQYALAAAIADGTATGQMLHGTGYAPIKSYVSGTKTYSVIHARVFGNSSGGTIVVAESGIRLPINYVQSAYGSPLVMRDVLSSSVSVATMVSLTVTYTLQVVFPA